MSNQIVFQSLKNVNVNYDLIEFNIFDKKLKVSLPNSSKSDLVVFMLVLSILSLVGGIIIIRAYFTSSYTVFFQEWWRGILLLMIQVGCCVLLYIFQKNILKDEIIFEPHQVTFYIDRYKKKKSKIFQKIIIIDYNYSLNISVEELEVYHRGRFCWHKNYHYRLKISNGIYTYTWSHPSYGKNTLFCLASEIKKGLKQVQKSD